MRMTAMAPQTQEEEYVPMMAGGNQVVKFNVGGTKYEASWALVIARPDSLLATIASESLIDDPEAEIFIDGNGARFEYCLDFLREGKAVIPVSISKEALISDLVYYGVKDPDAFRSIKYDDDHKGLSQATKFIVDASEKSRKEMVGLSSKHSFPRFVTTVVNRLLAAPFACTLCILSIAIVAAISLEHPIPNEKPPSAPARPVKFNVGGKSYDVARSILTTYPESILARMAAAADGQENEDPEAEMFIDRDGLRFRFILDYLRHGKVVLPITEVRDAILDDLVFFGINVQNPDAIVYGKDHEGFASRLVLQTMEETKLEIENHINQNKFLRFAKKSFFHIFAAEVDLPASLNIHRSDDREFYELTEQIYAMLKDGGSSAKELQTCFNRFGIELVNLRRLKMGDDYYLEYWMEIHKM